MSFNPGETVPGSKTSGSRNIFSSQRLSEFSKKRLDTIINSSTMSEWTKIIAAELMDKINDSK